MAFKRTQPRVTYSTDNIYADQFNRSQAKAEAKAADKAAKAEAKAARRRK